MLQSLDTKSLNRSNNSLTSVTPLTPTHTSAAEEKTQRRRSTFYVPLVIEDDEPTAPLSTTSPKDEVDKSSNSNSVSSLTSHSTSSKDFKNSSNINLKKSSASSLKGSKLQSSSSGSPRSATTSVKVTTLLFERANSTLGFSTTSSNSSNASSGYRSGSSKSSKKMPPPCGFNWSLTGVTDDMTADIDDDSDAAEFIIAMHKNKSTKTTSSTIVKETSSLPGTKRNSKISMGSTKSTPSNRLSATSSNKISFATATNHSTPIPKQRALAQSSARTKRYGIVLNGLDDGTSPRNSLTSSITEHLHNSTETRKSSSSYKSSTSSTKWPSPAPRTQFNEENDIVVTPTYTTSSSLSTPHNSPALIKTKQTPLTKRDNNSSLTSTITPMQNCSNNEFDDDDDSEISRMQTNTSTPIKMMKSRSRNNILSVPTSIIIQQSSEQNLINVAKIKASSSSSSSSTSSSTSTANTKQNYNSGVTLTPTKLTTINATTLLTPTPCVLRIKSKTLPQNLTPSVALKQGEALDNAASNTFSNDLAKNVKTKKSPLETSSSLNRKFGGSQACHLNRDTKNVKSSSANTIISTAFPPKNLFLLKSTPKLSASNSMSSSSDNSLTSPSNNANNYPPHPHQITSPAKKSLSFIRRAHSTKLSRSNSLLKSIASQHQQQMHGSNSAANTCSTFCSGSWGKDFYLQYDVCPLALDELDSYFRAEKCAELIRERFKIFDISELSGNSAAETLIQDNSTASSAGEGTIRNIDSSPSDKEHHYHHQEDDDDDDDAGHHSGQVVIKRISMCHILYVNVYCGPAATAFI